MLLGVLRAPATPRASCALTGRVGVERPGLPLLAGTQGRSTCVAGPARTPAREHREPVPTRCRSQALAAAPRLPPPDERAQQRAHPGRDAAGASPTLAAGAHQR